jgi:hypothetical protein
VKGVLATSGESVNDDIHIFNENFGSPVNIMSQKLLNGTQQSEKMSKKQI